MWMMIATISVLIVVKKIAAMKTTMAKKVATQKTHPEMYIQRRTRRKRRRSRNKVKRGKNSDSRHLVKLQRNSKGS